MNRRAFTVVRLLLVAACAAALLAACGIVYAVLRPVVTVTEVVEGEVVQAFYATGTLQPEHEYPVRSNTAGIVAKPERGQPGTWTKATASSRGRP